MRIDAIKDFLARYRAVFMAAWRERDGLKPPPRSNLEREFLPAALELQESPPNPLNRVLLHFIVFVFAAFLVWSIVGRVDTVAVATGKIIPSTRTQIIQPIETASVRRIHVVDGQRVEAGTLLLELDSTTPDAAVLQAREMWDAERLRAARNRALLAAIEHAVPLQPVLAGVSDVSVPRVLAESRLLADQFAEFTTRCAAMQAEEARAKAEKVSIRELVAKLEATLPIVQRRERDYKGLVEKAFVSRHGYLEQEQLRIEAERDLAYQRARLVELDQRILQAQAALAAYQAEFRRGASAELATSEQRASSAKAELDKADNHHRLMRLTAPVSGTVQQLAVHTIGGVVTPAQALMAIVPDDYAAEVEAILENRDVGFVKPGQSAEVKIETFPFTRYGTIAGEVAVVSSDAVADEQRGLVFPVRVRLHTASIVVDERTVNLTPGMAVTAEIKTGRRRLIEYLINPLQATLSESFRER